MLLGQTIPCAVCGIGIARMDKNRPTIDPINKVQQNAGGCHFTR